MQWIDFQENQYAFLITDHTRRANSHRDPHRVAVACLTVGVTGFRIARARAIRRSIPCPPTYSEEGFHDYRK